MLKTSRLPVLRFIAAAILGLALISPFLSYAYSEPTTNPPDTPDSIPGILNGSYTDQTKIGSLLIGERNGAVANCTDTDQSGCSFLCLNPDTTESDRGYAFINNEQVSATQRRYCITSWSQVAGWFTTGTYLRLFNYLSSGLDSGYISLQADTNNIDDEGNPTAQQFTFMAEAPSYMGNPSAIRTEGIADTNYAAQFLGTLNIAGQLCLNDQASGADQGQCISQWSDIAALTDQNIVRLRDLNWPQAKSSDDGSTATNGVLVADYLIAGSPSPVTALAYSSGDGVCQYPQETEANSPADCHLNDSFYIDPDFSDFYSRNGMGCEYGVFVIPFEITNTSLVALTASPDVAVVDCRESAQSCPGFITTRDSTDPRIIDVDPQSAYLQPGEKAKFTLKHFSVQGGATYDGIYRYRISIAQGGSVISEQSQLNCQNW